jgi:FMN phosphatase YigB (HAD superfamily)
MDTHSTPSLKLKTSIYPYELADHLDHYANDIKVLSLDCFDTILWRKTATPTDVFFKLQDAPNFKRLSINALQRVKGEGQARRLNLLNNGSSEVQLTDIYHQCAADLSSSDLEALANDELMLESEVCYAHPSAITLIEKATAFGLKIIIVSDTYLTNSQLTQLLTNTLPPHCLNSISAIYCSNEYKHSKASGLFKHVLSNMKLMPSDYLHIGDSFESDYMAATKASIPAVHLLHHTETLKELTHFHEMAISLIEPSIRDKQPLYLPFEGLLAETDFSQAEPDQLIGYASLGKILYPFAKFICDEVTHLRKTISSLKVIFLLRDAYLPEKMCSAINGESLGNCVRISRFTSYAASFRNQHDIDDYLSTALNPSLLNSIAKQLLIPESIAKPLIIDCLNSSEPTTLFLQKIHSEKIMNLIIKNSADYRERFKKYLVNEIDLSAGDTLMFVDLGYSGTAQKQLESVFKEEWNVDVIGRYLIQLTIPDWQKSRRGLIDPSWCDDRTMHMLVSYIALLEQLCTTNDSSVTDFNSNGHPIYSKSSIGSQQHQKLDLIQQHCVQFAIDAERHFKLLKHYPSNSELRMCALAELTRLLFFPTNIDLHFLKDFQFDLNLGTDDVFEVLNIEKGLMSLRRRGILGSSMEKNSKSFRSNIPSEYRSAGIEYTFSLIAQQRYNIDLKIADTTLRFLDIKAIIMNGQENSQINLKAQAMFDGYYSVLIPAGIGQFQIGLLMGQQFNWFQIESIECIPTEYILTNYETQYAQDCLSEIIINEIQAHENNLYQCLSSSSFMMIVPKQHSKKESVYRFVFRPISMKS